MAVDRSRVRQAVQSDELEDIFFTPELVADLLDDLDDQDAEIERLRGQLKDKRGNQ